ncbi:MAG TPA: NADH-quinone oxidoreductase subunit M, partial [Puia sp.]|nr:NADH-quinone oxidoreductase subunit M [Puia sp.]
MVPVLLIGIPLLAGLIGFSLNDAAAKGWSLFTSLLTLIVSLVGISMPRDSKMLSFSAEWMGSLNSHFSLGLDGTG